MRRTVPPSAEIEVQIDQLLAVGVGENARESLSELAELGARLIIQRAVEDEFDAWLGRARYERRPDYRRGLRNYESGLRNGFRPRTVQTAEGELAVEIPQVREAAETFASKLFLRGSKLVRTEPLKALVVGAFVRGLSMRDVESLCEKAGLGKLSKSTASRCARSSGNAVRRQGAATSTTPGWSRCSWTPRSSPCARTGPRRACWSPGDSPKTGERVLLSVTLGMRESHEDWQALGRDLIARGLGAPMLIVADGVPRADQSDRAMLAGLRSPALLCAPSAQPLRQAARARARTVQAGVLASARRGCQPKRRQQQLQALVDELDKAGYTAAARCLADDLDALVVHPRYPLRHRRRWRSTNLLERSLGEVKRRTKVIGRFPGEESCLTLVWAVLDLLITHETNGIRFNRLDRQRLKRIRYQGSDQRIPEEVTAA